MPRAASCRSTRAPPFRGAVGDELSGSSTVACSAAASIAATRKSCSIRESTTSVSFSRMSARSSSSVSNSDASEANSSSRSGRTFSRTSLTSTLNTASWPASCSAW